MRVDLFQRVGRGRGNVLRLTTVVLALMAVLPGAVAAQSPSPEAGVPVDPAIVAEIGQYAGPDPSVQYVGVTSDPSIYVAVIDRGAGRVNIYVCDGPNVKTWFTGTSADGAFTGTSEDGATATGSIADGTATGSVTLADGRTLTFTAAQASIPAGLYERDTVEDGVEVRGRTIVLPDGSAKGSSVKTPTCAQREAQFEAYMEAWRTAKGVDVKIMGNAAHREYLGAQAYGCVWANP